MIQANDYLLGQLIQKSPSGILMTGKDGRLKIINQATKNLITLIGDPMNRRPEEAIPIPELIQLFSDSEKMLEREFRYGHRDLFFRSIRLEEGGRLVVIDDISRAKQVERSQREFVANVSHELRTPATSISGYSQMLMEDKEQFDEDAQMMIEAIHRNGRRLNNLFEDLLTLSRIEGSREALPEDALSLFGIVQECVDKQQARADENQIQFNVIVSEDLLIESNRDAMIHIIGNLVENAVKYSNPCSLVTVRASFRDDFVQLEVIDLGIGISPAQQKRIFERFYRADKGRSRKVGGTGLGLSIVKKLADRLKVPIEVRSQIDRGSIFRIYLKPVRLS